MTVRFASLDDVPANLRPMVRDALAKAPRRRSRASGAVPQVAPAPALRPDWPGFTAVLCWELWIPGTPVSQGSMSSPRAGVVRHDNGPELVAWRGAVRSAAIAAGVEPAPKGSPVLVEGAFFVRPPKRLMRSVVAAGGVVPCGSGKDADKLVRAINDALGAKREGKSTVEPGVAFVDDCQAWCSASKWYSASTEGALVRISHLSA